MLLHLDHADNVRPTVHPIHTNSQSVWRENVQALQALSKAEAEAI